MVALMQETPPDQLQRLLIKKLKAGDANLRDVTAAAGLNQVTAGNMFYFGRTDGASAYELQVQTFNGPTTFLKNPIHYSVRPSSRGV